MTRDETAERLDPVQKGFLFHFPLGTPEADKISVAEIVIRHLYDGVGDLKLYRYYGDFGIVTTVVAERPLVSDGQFSPEDEYARALIGTHLEHVIEHPLMFLAETVS